MLCRIARIANAPAMSSCAMPAATLAVAPAVTLAVAAPAVPIMTPSFHALPVVTGNPLPSASFASSSALNPVRTNPLVSRAINIRAPVLANSTAHMNAAVMSTSFYGVSSPLSRFFMNSAMLRSPEAEKAAAGSEPAADTADAKTAAKTEEKKDASNTALEEAEKKIADQKDQIMRLVAEMENVRRRAREDVEKANKFAISGFAKNLLEVADDMERVLEHVPEEARQKDAGATFAMFEGIEMVARKLQSQLKSQGVEKYESLGKPFDPNFHDALFAYEDASKANDTVGQVIKEGYMMKDRVLRAAQVGTIKNPK